MNILFTCAGRRVVLMREFRRAMTDLGVSGKLVAIDLTDASAAFHWADVGLVAPPTGTIEYIPAVVEMCKRQQIDLIVPLTDLDLRSLARQRHRFDALGCQVMIASAESILLCRDKAKTNDYLRGVGLRSIQTYALDAFRREPFFPCFIKPIRGSASIGTGVLHSEAELNAHLATFGDLMLVQTYVPGAEYTLDIYRTRAGEVKCVVPRQRLSIRAGEVEKGLTVKDDQLIQAGVRLGEALDGAWGVINAQCRRSPGQEAFFFEINPRFGGGAPLAIAAGADLPRYVLEEALGMEVSARLGAFKPNLLMLRYDEAVYVDADDPPNLPGFDTPQKR